MCLGLFVLVVIASKKGAGYMIYHGCFDSVVKQGGLAFSCIVGEQAVQDYATGFLACS